MTKAVRRETIELVAGPHDGLRLEVARYAPILRIPATPPLDLALDLVEPEFADVRARKPRVHLYVRTAARSFDGTTRFLWRGLED